MKKPFIFEILNYFSIYFFMCFKGCL
uniref:Uncharacterized protein n=1 Tax=Anguilla anguilla TaxID=7936 RepID=A0A0E9SNQ3_ANGAN